MIVILGLSTAGLNSVDLANNNKVFTLADRVET